MRETPFDNVKKKKKNVDVAQFVHQRALCNIPVGNKSHKHNYLIQAHISKVKEICLLHVSE